MSASAREEAKPARATCSAASRAPASPPSSSTKSSSRSSERDRRVHRVRGHRPSPERHRLRDLDDASRGSTPTRPRRAPRVGFVPSSLLLMPFAGSARRARHLARAHEGRRAVGEPARHRGRGGRSSSTPARRAASSIPEPAEMIRNMLEFSDRTARDVMVPREDLEAIEIETPLHKVLTRASPTSATRATRLYRARPSRRRGRPPLREGSLQGARGRRQQEAPR